jgi:RHS repeat-associated protein
MKSKKYLTRNSVRVLTAILLTIFVLEPVAFVFAQENLDISLPQINNSNAPSENTQTGSVTPVISFPTSENSDTPETTETPSQIEETPNSPDLPKSDIPSNEESDPEDVPPDEESPLESSGSDPDSPSTSNPTFTYQSISPKVEKATGALVQSLPIVVPKGRNGLEPNLALTYNSQNLEDGSVVGYGWNVNIPYIERINRRGTNNLYTDNYFTSSLSGELSSTTVFNQYKPKVEESNSLSYTFSTSTSGGNWIAYDKNGTQYTFGTSTSARVEDGGDSSKVFRWMLVEVRDTNNNYIRFEYYKDSGQIYPYKIYYTGNGTTEGIFQVEFSRESRPDVITSYKTAFLVQTNYRISQIQSKVNGTWVHQYVLAYTSGSNTKRSLLSSVTEAGQDESGGGTTTLPAVTFEYGNDSVTFTQDIDYELSNVSGPFRVVTDINGDGLLDQGVSLWDFPAINIIRLNWNDGNSTQLERPDISHDNPYFDEFWADHHGGPNSLRSVETGTRYFDLNGDGFADILRSQYVSNSASTTQRVYWNDGLYSVTGQLSWTQATPTPAMPIFSSSVSGPGSSASTLGIFGNLNGDGVIDYEMANTSNGGPQGDDGAYFGSGIGFIGATGYFAPKAEIPVQGILDTAGSQLIDINGDGLDDWVYNVSTTTQVCLNTGLAWQSNCENNFKIATTSSAATTGYDRGTRFADINGDGLVDFVHSYKTIPYNNVPAIPDTEVSTINMVMLNTGSGWATSTLTVPYPIAEGQVNGSSNFTGLFYVKEMWDWSGDGLADQFDYKNNSHKPDMIEEITYPTGGSTEITYTPTTQQMESNLPKHKNLPMVVHTVTGITHNDGNGTEEEISYAYTNGDFYFNHSYDRKFAGFENIIETRSNSITKTYYYQGNSSATSTGEVSDDVYKIGKIFREDVSNTSGNLFKRTFYNWDSSVQSNNRGFISLARTLEQSFDGSVSHKDKGSTFTYDSTTGNLIQKIDYGEVTGSSDGTFSDIGTDLASTTISYVASTTVNMFLPSSELTHDQSLNKVSETRHYYDSQSLGVITKGNETKTEFWKSSSSYASTTKTYDGTYGLVVSEKEANANTTAYTFDSNNLYVATSTNALGHTTGFTYNYASGKTKSTYDSNGKLYTTTYDGLGRPLTVNIPDPDTGSLVTKTSYTYTDSSTAGSTKIQQTDYLNSATSTDTYTYFDGLGRNLQQRKTAEGTNTYTVKDWTYNTLGLLGEESLPYFASSTSRSTATSTDALFTTYTYDALQRISTTTNAVGATGNVYTGWTLTTTDPNGNIKDYVKDAYGNLSNVVEHISGTYATTTYTWDLNKNLTKITDALGNIRNFTYDGISHRLTAEDLHAVGDTTFGTTTYAYDDNGNLTQKTDPNATILSYIYDVLNRPATTTVTSSLTKSVPVGVKVSYVYDSCTRGVGKLCLATYADDSRADYVDDPYATSTENNTTAYTYNHTGQVATETKTIHSKSFTNSSTYDRLGNISSLTDPLGNKTSYVYNNAGLIDVTLYTHSITPATSTIATFNYSPPGQVTQAVFENGMTVVNTYDVAHMYRLSNKNATSSSVAIQNLAYTYDAVGNITKIVDSSSTNSAKTIEYVYDNLNRLTSASSTLAVSGGNYLYSYTYDVLGNLLTKVENNATSTYAYAGNTGSSYANPHAVTSINGGSTYTYDHNGNLISGFGRTNRFDYNGLLTTDKYVGTEHWYVYDHAGQRISMEVDGEGKTYYPSKFYNIEYDTTATTTVLNHNSHVFAGDVVLATIAPPEFASNLGTCSFSPTASTTLSVFLGSCTVTGTVLLPYSLTIASSTTMTLTATSTLLMDLHHNKLLVKKGGGVLIKYGGKLRQVTASDLATTTTYHLTDHLGSITATTNSSGTLTQLTDYYPYGSIRLDERTGSAKKEQRKYIGQEYDVDTDLSYLNARYYDGGRGRFLSQDPVFWELKQNLENPQSLNSYSYANGNPVVNKDPSGRCAGPLVLACLGIIGAGLNIGATYAGEVIQNRAQNNPNPYQFTLSHETIAWKGTEGAISLALLPEKRFAASGYAFFTSLIDDKLEGNPYDLNKATVSGGTAFVTGTFFNGAVGKYSKSLTQKAKVGSEIFQNATGIITTNYSSIRTTQQIAQIRSNFSFNYSQSSALVGIISAFSPQNSAQAAAVQQVISAFSKK